VLRREMRVEYCLDETIPFINPPFYRAARGLRESVAQV